MCLKSISPLDGRYSKQIEELSDFFSEFALMKYRIKIEIEYVIALSNNDKFYVIKRITNKQSNILCKIYTDFTLDDAEKIKNIEKSTKHDIKAIEYFLQNKFKENNFEYLIPFIHFAITSEDINNLAYLLMWQDSIHNVFIPILDNLIVVLENLSKKYRNLAMLSMTHGQPATPTTFNKEINVYKYRLNTQIKKLKSYKLSGKFNGAVGNFAAHKLTFPKINWEKFSKEFLLSIELNYSKYSTQVNSYDSLSENFSIVNRINIILLDLSIDMWLYISRGILALKVTKKEIGSSTMPHKINPINFENAEGNLNISNALFNILIKKLPQSRMQRDLSGSTMIRNQGVALSHSLLAIKNITTGLDKLMINKDKIKDELQENFSVIAEGIQTILRKNGDAHAYEKIKELTKDKHFTQEEYFDFLQKLKLNIEDKDKLKKLKPENYL